LAKITCFKCKYVQSKTDSGIGTIETKYLTVFWLFIPYWKTIHNPIHFTKNVTEKSIRYATKRIEEHKVLIKDNRNNFNSPVNRKKTVYL